MTEKVSINEKSLLYRIECPMRWNGYSTVPESPVLACAETTARWLISERYYSKVPTAAQTREVFDVAWKQTAYFGSRSGISQKEYERRVMAGARACRRLRDILWRCEILQSSSPYALPIGGVVITGEYAVLRSSRRKKHAFALYLRDHGVRIKPLIPDVVSFARRLDLGNRWIDPANRHWGIQSVGIMHYWVTRDLSAEHKLDRACAEEVLIGAASVVAGHPFPMPGDHCLYCPTRGCRPDDPV